jgi:sugar (pentulose or hexulose) kinase
MPFIGIDLGTSFIKGALLDTRTLRPMHVVRIPFPEPIAGMNPLFREFDPGPIVAAARSILEQIAPLADGCEGILWSTQMHGLVLCTPRGEARSNLVTWTDQRVTLPHPSGRGSYFDELVSRITPDERRQLGGMELRPGLPVGSLFHMAENKQLPGGEIYAASLADFVVSHLGGQPPVTELSNGQAHGAMNIETGAWHGGVIEKLGLGGVKWPRIVPHGSVVGHVKIAGRDLPMFTPVGDFQCAMVGSLLQPGELSLNISTGSQVSLLRPTLEYGPFQTRPFFDGRFLVTITTIPAGRALNGLVKLVTEMGGGADPWAYIISAAEKASDPAMRVSLSFFASAMGDRGGIADLREEEMTVGHLFRAAFRNMAENYAACAARLSPTREWGSLVFSGGLVNKIDLLRRFICDRFGNPPHRFAPHAEDAMIGLLALGLAWSGHAGSVEDAVARIGESFRN